MSEVAMKSFGRLPDQWETVDLIDANRPAWHAQARCKGDTDLFFPTVGAKSCSVAKRTCNGAEGSSPCPVRDECLAFALAHREIFGVWGGKSERQRRMMRSASSKTTELDRVLDLLADGEWHARPEVTYQLAGDTLKDSGPVQKWRALISHLIYEGYVEQRIGASNHHTIRLAA